MDDRSVSGLEEDWAGRYLLKTLIQQLWTLEESKGKGAQKAARFTRCHSQTPSWIASLNQVLGLYEIKHPFTPFTSQSNLFRCHQN